jgi:hypothetical protein
MRYSIFLAGGILAAVVCLAVPAEAQPGGGGRERPSADEMEKFRQEAREKFIDALQLDEVQIPIVDSLLTAQYSARADLMEEMRSGFADRETIREMRTEVQELQEDTEAKINALLTEAQRELFKAFREQQAERRGQWGRGRRGGDGDGQQSGSGGEEDSEDDDRHEDGEEPDDDGNDGDSDS